jgi:peroxiredoxin Q/BCP
MLATGLPAPGFTLHDHAGAPVSWEDFRGHPVVVFFYPKADTPGCTREACAFRDLTPEFTALGVKIVGISADPVKRQAGFQRKYDLTMPLLADPDHAVLEPWGVWAEKVLYGKKSMGIVRTTFLFDAAGVLRHAWPKVKVDGHAEAVLERARALVSGG